MNHHSLAGPKNDQRPIDKTATDLVGQLQRFKADGNSAPGTAPVEPPEMPGGVITKHDSHVAADPSSADVIVSHSNPDPVASAVVLAQAAQLAKPEFQADATHLELAYRVHRILVAARQGELAIPHGVDRDAVRRFVDEVFFATQFLNEDIHSEAKARANRPYTTDRSGVLGVSETTDRENDVCRPSWDAGGAERPIGESGIDTDVQARRIADELIKLHEAGAIKSEQDASFYANLVHLFGASFTGPAGSAANTADHDTADGKPSPGVLVPGKPYTSTQGQRVRIPLGLSREQRMQWLQDDLDAIS